MTDGDAVRARLQGAAGVLLGGALIAAIASGGFGPGFLPLFILCTAVLGGLWFLFTRWLSRFRARSRAAAGQEMRERDARVFALTLPEARERAERLLTDPAKFDRAPSAAGDAPPLDSLSPSLREFFSRHPQVRIRHGDMVLDRSLVGPSELNPRFIRIGRETAHTEFAVLANSDAVFEIDGSEENPAEMRQYPSIYHLILSLCATIYPEEAGHSRV